MTTFIGGNPAWPAAQSILDQAPWDLGVIHTTPEPVKHHCDALDALDENDLDRMRAISLRVWADRFVGWWAEATRDAAVRQQMFDEQWEARTGSKPPAAKKPRTKRVKERRRAEIADTSAGAS